LTAKRKEKMTEVNEKMCSICDNPINKMIDTVSGKVYWIDGHNAEPINSGRCCSTCNDTYVIPARIFAVVGNG
tara:strand:- start:496 stop:714 length:219 start_codon:yes stop_codon:yes gene_type:complete